ncbi:dihydroxyacetone phosphatase family protein [Clostridium sp. D5]|nr:dihydroxyacetone phosphatase family protein [Clostridium sp. D5]
MWKFCRVITTQKTELSPNVYEVFETAGKTMIMSMGGASGVIFGSLYQAGAKGMEPSPEVRPGELAVMFRKSLEAIKERGKASVGDKTMVDALEPAVCAMEENYGDGFQQMMEKAEACARQGFESTREMTAKFGRAKSLMERAVGYPDAGAASVWLIFRSMKEYLAENGSSVKER